MLGQHADNVTLVFHTLLVACHYVKAHYTYYMSKAKSIDTYSDAHRSHVMYCCFSAQFFSSAFQQQPSAFIHH